MSDIKIGATNEQKLLVTQEVAIDFLESPEARVLSTPNMILGLERTSRNILLPLLDHGYDSVGTHVDVYHLAATPLGMTVTFRSEVVSVEDRRVNFKVEAFDEKEKVAEGTHERFIVHAQRFAARVQEKAALAALRTRN